MGSQERRRSRDFCVHAVVFVLLWFIRESFLVIALAFVCLLALFCSLSWGEQQGRQDIGGVGGELNWGA